MKLRKPVLLVVFRRADLTKTILDTLAKVQPPRLYLAADAARPQKPGEAEKCAAVRALLADIPWPCEVFRDYAETNLGAKERVASAITWFFEHETDGIILEDDCHPADSFFPFCEELLDRYRDDPRVMVISGDRGLKEDAAMENSYYFSKYMLTWGWATWRRAWQHYDETLPEWPVFQGEPLRKKCLNDAEHRYWKTRLERVMNGQLDAWDFRWTICCWMQNGLSIIPARNLIQNVGFGADATHTTDNLLGNFSYEMSALTFPLKHPKTVEADHALEIRLWKDKFKPAGFLKRVRRKLLLIRSRLLTNAKPALAAEVTPASGVSNRKAS